MEITQMHVYSCRNWWCSYGQNISWKFASTYIYAIEQLHELFEIPKYLNYPKIFQFRR